MLLRELHKQAQLEGGAVYMLNGNHESLNVSGNFRYCIFNNANRSLQQPFVICRHAWHRSPNTYSALLQ